MSDPINIAFSLRSDYIELYKLLKLEGLVPSGGVAKLLISEGQVQVNGQIELRKRCKLVAGDFVNFDLHRILITDK